MIQNETHPNAKIALVGEAPGAHEEQRGRPFCGPSGYLLDNLLRQAGLLRSQCNLTNVIMKRPPSNKISLYIRFQGKNAIASNEYTEHEENLRQTLEEWQPNVIVALGNVALYALTRETGIMSWRGSILPCSLVPGLKVVPTIHPAAALRQYINTYSILFDLKRAKEEAASPDHEPTHRDMILSPTISEAITELESFHEVPGPISCDIEIENDTVSCIAFAATPFSSICIPFIERNNNHYWAEDEEVQVWEAIHRLFDSGQHFVFQNGLFDTSFLYQELGLECPGFHEDTMIGFAQAYPDLPKGLGFITSVCTREPYYKYMLKESKGGLG